MRWIEREGGAVHGVSSSMDIFVVVIVVVVRLLLLLEKTVRRI